MSDRGDCNRVATMLSVQHPTWDAPDNVSALFTSRRGGESTGPWGDADGVNGLNLGANCGDSAERVQRNRGRLETHVGRPIRWLNQVHGTRVVDTRASDRRSGQGDDGDVVAKGDGGRERKDDSVTEEADAHVAVTSGVALGILVADCLPVLLADRAGTVVGAAHAGWRGLSAGILENTVDVMRAKASSTASTGELLAWLGPCIGPCAFEVGEEVVEAFARDDADAVAMFRPGVKPGKWWADLAGLAARRLHRVGVTSIVRAGACTVTHRDDWWSYRRDGVCGRMAAVVWLNDRV